MNNEIARPIAPAISPTFSSSPVNIDSSKKLAVSFDDLQSLVDSMVDAMELDMDTDHKVMLQSEIEHRYDLWLSDQKTKIDPRDFLNSKLTKIVPTIIVR